MIHEQRLHILEEWYERSKKWNDGLCQLYALLGCEGILCRDIADAGERMHESFTKLVSIEVGDKHRWLWWWATEDTFGKSKLSARAAKWKRSRRIPNVEALCKLIEADLEGGAR